VSAITGAVIANRSHLKELAKAVLIPDTLCCGEFEHFTHGVSD
jgi:hypothetical protein